MKIKRIVSSLLLGVCLIAGYAGNSGAQSAPQNFGADSQLQIGTIVELNEEDSSKVQAATQQHLESMFGVVIDPSEQPLTITDSSKPNQVFVATSGRYRVLVTDENGPISTSDNITLSSLNGTAMKASNKQSMIFGRALESFDGQNGKLTTVQLKDTNGDPYQNVNIGLISVAIDIRNNPDVLSTKTRLPDFLEEVGLQIAEKPVSPVRLYVSVGVMALSVIIALVILITGIRNSIISIGRNPLSRNTIIRALLQIFFASFIVLIIGAFAVYLLLKL